MRDFLNLIRLTILPNIWIRFIYWQVLIYSLEKYDEKFLVPELHAAIGAENVRAVRVSLSLDTSDLAKGCVIAYILIMLFNAVRRTLEFTFYTKKQDNIIASSIS